MPARRKQPMRSERGAWIQSSWCILLQRCRRAVGAAAVANILGCPGCTSIAEVLRRCVSLPGANPYHCLKTPFGDLSRHREQLACRSVPAPFWRLPQMRSNSPAAEEERQVHFSRERGTVSHATLCPAALPARLQCPPTSTRLRASLRRYSRHAPQRAIRASVSTHRSSRFEAEESPLCQPWTAASS
jgi:hypothetical protein